MPEQCTIQTHWSVRNAVWNCMVRSCDVWKIWQFLSMTFAAILRPKTFPYKGYSRYRWLQDERGHSPPYDANKQNIVHSVVQNLKHLDFLSYFTTQHYSKQVPVSILWQGIISYFVNTQRIIIILYLSVFKCNAGLPKGLSWHAVPLISTAMWDR